MVVAGKAVSFDMLVQFEQQDQQQASLALAEDTGAANLGVSHEESGYGVCPVKPLPSLPRFPCTMVEAQ
eukprot:12899166-Prorocentrum_lima.AAC.1